MFKFISLTSYLDIGFSQAQILYQIQQPSHRLQCSDASGPFDAIATSAISTFK